MENYNKFNEKHNQNLEVGKKQSEERNIEKRVESFFKSLDRKQDQRTKTISVRASEIDYVTIKAKAKLLSLSMSEFLAKAAKTKKVA